MLKDKLKKEDQEQNTYLQMMKDKNVGKYKDLKELH